MRFSKAKWVPVRNFAPDGQEAVLGLVVHIMDGTLEGSQSWFNNPDSSASSTFGTGKDGELRQWVDTKDRAWAQGSGNRTYLSIENEGRGGDSLTPAQIEANAQTFAWVCREYGVPVKLAAYVGDKGLAYHGLGGSAWGGHTSCPGSKIVAQLPLIVERAKAINNPQEDDLTPEQAKQLAELHAALVPYKGWNYKGKDATSDAYGYLVTTAKKVASLATTGITEAQMDALAKKVADILHNRLAS